MLALNAEEHSTTSVIELYAVQPQPGLRTICVFGGAAPGVDPRMQLATERLGLAMALAGFRLVYGGGATGLMGAIARSAAKMGGEVIAIAPRFLVDRQNISSDFGQLILTPCMHTRKRLMFDYADAFVALPGGIGTIDEMAEVMTWSKLDQHRKPIVVANFEGFWSPWLALLDHLDSAGFLRAGTVGKCLVADNPDAVLPLIMSARQPVEDARRAH